MNQTRTEYISEQRAELAIEGLTPLEIQELNFDNEYYTLVEDHLKQGKNITNEMYNDLTQGQKYHFNKKYNSRGDKVLNSDYTQTIEAGEKQIESDFNKYLEGQKQIKLERDIEEQREKKNLIKRLNEEAKQLHNNLFDYDKLSLIGKRNVKRIDHERKQNEINQRILEIKDQIKNL